MRQRNIRQRLAAYQQLDPFEKRRAAEKPLTGHVIPWGWLPHPLRHETAIGGLSRRTCGIKKRLPGQCVQAVRNRLSPHCCAITAPCPFRNLRHQTGPHWIEQNITTELQQVRIFLHKEALESALEHMPHTMMPAIKPLGVGSVEASHALAQIGLWGFHDQMVVIVHQTVHITAPVLLINFLRQQPEELLPISVIKKEGLLGVPAGGKVVERTRKLQSKRSSHRRRRYGAESARSRTAPLTSIHHNTHQEPS